MTNIRSEIRRINYILGDIDRLYHEAALKLGISDSALTVLYTLVIEGRCGISTVCRLTGMSKQTLNSALRKLEKDGIITLEAVDGRTKEIKLTPNGNRLAENTAARVAEAETRAEYLRLTEKYLHDLEKEVEKL